jgi:hypothetical protein
LEITITLSFYFDKVFYFIKINDRTKKYLKRTISIHFENYSQKSNSFSQSKITNIIQSSKNLNQSRNTMKKITFQTKINKKESYNNSINNSTFLLINENDKMEASKILKIINEYKKNINKDKFIFLIKLILTIIIIIILIIYFYLTKFQVDLINNMELFLLAYHYNLYTKAIFIEVQYAYVQILYDSYFFNMSQTEIIYDRSLLINAVENMRVSYHYFEDYFYDYNLLIGHDIHLLHDKIYLSRIMGFFKELKYKSSYSKEIDCIAYNTIVVKDNILLSDNNLKDFDNLIFLRGKERKEKVNYMYGKLVYYFNMNYEFLFKDIFNNIEKSIYNSQKLYTRKNVYICLMFEIICLILYAAFFIAVIFYLYYSNNIIIKNVIFIFLDFREKYYDKYKFNNANNLITLKLKELQRIIDDFDIHLYEQYIINLDNINNYKFLKNEVDNNLNYNSNKNTSVNGNNSNNNADLRSSFKQKLKKNSIEESIDKSASKNANLLLDKNNKNMNNSSHNYLVESNSKFFKSHLSSHSISMSNDFLSNKSELNSGKYKINDSKNNLDKNKTIEKDNYYDILLNDSNKSFVLKCKIFFLMIFVLLLILIFIAYYKFNYILSFEKKYKQFFNDITVLTNRYMQIYYYFNSFRALIIFPDDERREIFANIMNNMNEEYEKGNKEYKDISLKNINNYKEINEIFKIIKSNNSTSVLKEIFCFKNESCQSYIDSKYNIFKPGIDFAFKTSMIQIMNIYMAYKRLSDKNNIQEIKTKILFANDHFSIIMKSLNYFYLYIIQKIFTSFNADEIDFKNYFIRYIISLNIISIIYSIVIFLFVVIYIFVSLYKFTKPIKESAYRITCSLHFIKNYSLGGRYNLSQELNCF